MATLPPPPGAPSPSTAAAMDVLFESVEATELAQRALQQLEQQMQGLRVENDLLRERLGMLAPVSPFQNAPSSKTSGGSQQNGVVAHDSARDNGSPKKTSSTPSNHSSDSVNRQISQKEVRAAMHQTHGAWKSQLAHHEDHPASHFIPDHHQMKLGARKAILQGIDIADFYHKGGVCQAVVSSAAFEYVASGVVLANAFYIAIDADVNGKLSLADKSTFFNVMEFFFFAYFILEWLLRLGAFKRKVDGLKDRWFIFDTAMVVLSLVDVSPLIYVAASGSESSASGGKTSMLRLVRLAKLTKMARMARLLRKWPELTILIKGLFISSRSVMSTMVLMMVIVSLFSVAFRQLSHGTEVGTEYFNSVPHGISTLFLGAAFPDAGDLIIALGDENILYGLLACLYFFVASLTLLNMLIGVLCEVVNVVSSVERDAMQVAFVKKAIVDALAEAGIEFNRTEVITKDEFHNLLMKPTAAKAIRAAGVDLVGLVDFSDYIFGGEFKAKGIDGGSLTLEQLIEVILELGGTNNATVKDIIDSRKIMVQKLEAIDEQLEHHMSNITTTMSLMLGSTQFTWEGKDPQGTATMLAKTQNGSSAKAEVAQDALQTLGSPQTSLFTL